MYNPLFREVQVSGGLFAQRPTLKPGTVLVLFQKGQPVRVMQGSEQLTFGELMWGKYSIYEVDISARPFTFSCSLPCASDAFEFYADMSVTYEVHPEHAGLIVKHGLTDGRATVEAQIIRELRTLSRRFDAQQSGQAEAVMVRTVEQWQFENPYLHMFKIRRFDLQLRLEDTTRVHIRDVAQFDRERIMMHKQAELEREREQLQMQLWKMRMDFYQPYVTGGHWQQLIVQLAKNPDDMDRLIERLNQHQMLELDKTLKILQVMGDADAIEGFELQGVGKATIQRLIKLVGMDGEVRERGGAAAQPLPNGQQAPAGQLTTDAADYPDGI